MHYCSIFIFFQIAFSFSFDSLSAEQAGKQKKTANQNNNYYKK